MPEVTAADLRRLKDLERRIVSTNDTLADVREARDTARNEAKELRAVVRSQTRDIKKLSDERADLSQQIDALLDENSRLSGQLDEVSGDHTNLLARVDELVAKNEELSASQAELDEEVGKLRSGIEVLTKDRNRLSKQLSQVSAQLDDEEATEVQPDQLSALLSDFVAGVGAQTGLQTVGTELKLKVGFTGRNGGGFVVPSAGADPEKYPELHDIKIELAPALMDREH